MIVYGINPVLEALRAGRVASVRVTTRLGGRVDEIIGEADRRGIPVRRVLTPELDRSAEGGVHQGVVAELIAAGPVEIDDLLPRGGRARLLVVLDGVEDPHNVGAILRTVDAAGADGVVRQTRHAAPLAGAVAKTSAGASLYVPVADVVNIARTLEALKAAGVWTVGLAADAPTRYDQVDYTLPTALVVGSEGRGLRRLVRERCDWLVHIPMRGRVSSLNVSVAAGVVLFEAVRQRSVGGASSDQER